MPHPPQPNVGDHLIRVVKLVHAARHAAPRVHPDVDPMHYPLMFLIWEGVSRVSELSVRLHADISTVSRQVSALTAAGLIERCTDPRDGRAQVLGLTDEGKGLLLRLRADRDAWLERVLGDWEPGERDSLAALLSRFAGSIEADLAAHAPANRRR